MKNIVLNHYKDNKNLSLIFSNKNRYIKYKNRLFDYYKIAENVDIKHITGDLLEEYITSKETRYNSINEVKYDFSKIDPRTGMPAVKKRDEDKIHLMSEMPARSCWIYVLQNRVSLNSVGNNRFKKLVWYDAKSKSLSSSKEMSDAENFRLFVLKNGAKPAGWIYEEDTPVNLRNRR